MRTPCDRPLEDPEPRPTHARHGLLAFGPINFLTKQTIMTTLEQLERAEQKTGERISYKSPLYQMTQTTPTCLWNDSASIEELAYSIENGAVGATCNPVIVVGVLKKEMAAWRDRIRSLIQEMPTATEDQIGWQIVREISVKAAGLLQPIFEQQNGRNGRLSIQTDPRLYRNTEAILEQAVEFSQLAPNIIVKLPVTRAGLPAIEEATYRGVSINATVSFTLPQVIAVAEAVERGLKRRESQGKDISTMGPVCTIMVGRLDDWLKAVAEKESITTDPGYLEWAGVVVFKKAYQIFRERGYRIRLLSAAFRNHMHWSEFIGGDVVISPPYAWQVRYNASDIAVVPRIDKPVDPTIVNELSKKFIDFRRAYNEDGLTPETFDLFGPTRRTLRQFIAGCSDLGAIIRDFMLPEW
jgi:transaldolase